MYRHGCFVCMFLYVKLMLVGVCRMSGVSVCDHMLIASGHSDGPYQDQTEGCSWHTVERGTLPFLVKCNLTVNTFMVTFFVHICHS